MVRGGAQRIPRPPDWRQGGPPPWAGLHEPANRIDEAVVRRLGDVAVSSAFEGGVDGDSGEVTFREAAVLVPFHDAAPGLELVFVRRRDDLRSHAGEVAFPGGTRDLSDADLLATALREAEEEVGLDPRRVDVIGRLQRVVTYVTGFTVMPFLGWVHDAGELRPQESEIQRVLEIPVATLLDPDAYHEELWLVRGGWTPIHFFDVEGETIWGLTARILRNLFDRLFEA